MSKIEHQIDIAVISGVKELSDRAAAKCSGGYIVQMLSDSGKVLDSKNITAKNGLDFYNGGEFIQGVEAVRILGEPGATYDLTINTETFTAIPSSTGKPIPGTREVVDLTSKGWSSDSFVTKDLNTEGRVLGYEIERTS